jgi:uncharacterized protein
MSYYLLAFFTGLFGSLHCVAMCGPLVMALPLANQSPVNAFLQRLLYQAGRICIYAFLGLLLGWVGSQFNVLGWQQGLSIFTGAFLILLAFFHFSQKNIKSVERLQNKLVIPLSVWMGKLLTKPYGGFFAGMLNGLLPCGMVYLALAGAINTSSLTSGAVYMMMFGLGTAPMMLAAAFASVFLRKRTRFNFSSLLPYLTLCMGLWLVLRGAQLGIPYVSPSYEMLNGGVICE